ncbi:hypothetical protein JTE90_024995 [Oedothorax gibbosus]|uniref:MAGE domain-containing protein n=1 Tax=Oedothorax gibbosus TaxID=931172 RepID=A0AAV6VXF5_9ARAC|nr:hypothetical protein JTE90_024995 [Oedothorax gibbosus]
MPASKRSLRSQTNNSQSPPPRDTTRTRQSVSLPSTSRSASLSPPPSSSKRANLNASQSFNRGSPSKQGGYLKNLISKCVSYILVADQKKHAIRKADILKNVFENANPRDFTYVIGEANKVLKKTFGLELLLLKNQKNSYILINILDPDYGIQECAEFSEEELQKRALIFLLLTIIFMNENYIAEDKLWKALENLGVYPNSSTPHPVFGNIKKYITVELVKEMYFEYVRVNKDPIQYELRWGERAHQEVKKKDLLEFACSIMGDCQPQDWKLQFRDANPNEA